MTQCRNGLWVLGAVMALIVLSSASATRAANRDLIVMPKVAAESIPMTGDYWALIVGIDKYKYVSPLETATRDATAVRDVLVERYGFKTERVTVLLNEQASREGIEEALYHLGKKAGPNDSVFIYYAGHGQVDLESQRGFWVPVEGKAQSPSTFISNALIRDEIASMKAKHVYFVADSCFSGTLFAKSRALPPLNDKFFARLYANKSRWGLTSGQNEPVADQGKGGHSMFAYFFLKLLKENDEPYLVPSHIYDQIAPLVGRNAEQQPRSEPLQGAGDEGGQFVFRLASVSGGSLSQPSGTSGGLGIDALAEERKKLESERAQLKADREAIERAQQQAEERAKLAVEREKLEVERKQLKTAKAYELHKQTGREITGKDGAPMMLVPEGEFLYGDEKQQLSLTSFYMDKFEVSTAQYAKFMAVVGVKEPAYWPMSVLISNGQKPVVGVSWHEATAYCRHYGKRLPTEQEWEKAARGTDGRNYPWGNEMPTSRHANFEQSDFNEYGALVNVGSLEEGKSPYGIYDLAGNVVEWTSSDYDGSKKVIRGGSWNYSADNLRATSRDRWPPDFRYYLQGFRCVQDAPK